MTTEISTDMLAEKSPKTDYALIDVRTPNEFQESHISDSMNVPLADLGRFANELREEASRSKIVLVCRTGRRAEIARQRLAKQGVNNACILAGGIVAWSNEGHAVRNGRKGMSIERQVRITAGSLVVIGVGLGFWLHPGFFGIAAFVGAGLVFAGITDTCGMAILLGQLPSNRLSSLASQKGSSQ